MSVRRVAKPNGRQMMIEKKAWFLCKFLSRVLDEDTYEKIRHHISICKGVKTKVKLSDKGWSTGYKTSSLRHFGHKLPYEFFPLQFVVNLQQDVMFVNVLLCVFRMQNLPDMQYEVVAYKFPDNATVKKFQDIFEILTGAEQTQTLRAPGSSLAMVPSRSYHMGTMSPDRWGSRDRLATTDSVVASEMRMNDPSRRELSSRRMILDSEGSWSGGSSFIDDNQTVFRTGDGTVVAPAAGSTYGRPRNNITLTGVDSYDGPRRLDAVDSVNHKIYSRPPSDRGRTYEQSIQRNRYQSTDSASNYGRSRSVDPYRGGGSRMGDGYGRSAGTMTPRNGYMASDNRSDVMSVRSQSSYLLSPKFKKVYMPRNGQLPNGSVSGSVQNLRPRAYAGSEIRRNDGW